MNIDVKYSIQMLFSFSDFTMNRVFVYERTDPHWCSCGVCCECWVCSGSRVNLKAHMLMECIKQWCVWDMFLLPSHEQRVPGPYGSAGATRSARAKPWGGNGLLARLIQRAIKEPPPPPPAPPAKVFAWTVWQEKLVKAFDPVLATVSSIRMRPSR